MEHLESPTSPQSSLDELEISEQRDEDQEKNLDTVDTTLVHSSHANVSWETQLADITHNEEIRELDKKHIVFWGRWAIWICTLTIRKVLGCLKHAAIRL